MPEPRLIEPQTAHDRIQQDDALLVCAYADRQKCAEVGLPGAITRDELDRRRDQLDRVRELVFYCN
jgi:hypothetical protein